MSQLNQSASHRQRARVLRVVVRILFATLIGSTASATLLSAQSSPPAALPSAPETPTAHAPSSVPVAAPKSTADNFSQWSQPAINPFQPNPNFGNYSGASAVNFGFTSARGFRAGRQSAGGFNQLGGSSQFGGAGQWGGYGMGNANSSTRGANSLFGPSPFGLPSLNQVMRGSYNPPLNSATSSFRFTYQDALRPGASFGDLARPSASAVFSTSDLGNGMFLSAGTNFGRSTAGAPAAGANAAEGKHSGTTLGVKLSF